MIIPLTELISEHQVRPKGIIHVGGHDLNELDDYLKNEISKVIWIEPNPMQFSRLEQRLMPYPQFRAYHFAPYDKDAQILELNVLEAGSTLRPMQTSRGVIQRIQVGSRTLDSFYRTEGLDPQAFNFLYVNTEGTEFETMKGAKSILPHMEYVYTDLSSTHHQYDGQFVAEAVDVYLGEFGFVRRTTRLNEALYIRLH